MSSVKLAKKPGPNAPHKLPGTLHGLLEVAIADGTEVVLAGDDYWPTYGRWHSHNQHEDLCHVCLAGAVIAGTLDISYDASTAPSLLPEYEMSLYALEHLRTGDYVSAYMRMYDAGPAPEHYLSLAELGSSEDRNFRNKESFSRFLDFLEAEVLPVLKHLGI